MLNENVVIILLIAWLIKKIKNEWIKSSKGRVKQELDLSNCETKADLKNATGVDTPDFAKKLI